MLPPELQDKVYRPGADESYNVDLKFDPPKSTTTEVLVDEVEPE
jgi:hypothetical protein